MNFTDFLIQAERPLGSIDTVNQEHAKQNMPKEMYSDDCSSFRSLEKLEKQIFQPAPDSNKVIQLADTKNTVASKGTEIDARMRKKAADFIGQWK